MMMHSVVGPGPGGSTGGSIEKKKSNLSRLSHDRMKIPAGYNFGLI